MMVDDAFQPDRVMPVWDSEEKTVNEELPTELHEFFETFDAEPDFKVTVQSFRNDQYNGRPSVTGEYINEIPNYERLVKTDGPKYYRYKILYKHEGVKKKKVIDVDLTSKNWKILAKEGDRERTRERQDQIKEDMAEQNALLAYGAGGKGGQQTGKEAMKDTMDMMMPFLELIKGGSGKDDGGMGFKEMMLFMMQMQQANTNSMMNMFGMMSKQNSSLAAAMMGNTGGEADKLFNMAERMLGFQEKISPKEESLIDKIGNFIGNNIEQLGELLAKPREVREKDTGYKKVKDDWRFKKIKKKMETNETFAKRLIRHIDQKLGNSETTDKILEGFIKYNRKPEQAPAQDDENITESDFDEEKTGEEKMP